MIITCNIYYIEPNTALDTKSSQPVHIRKDNVNNVDIIEYCL